MDCTGHDSLGVVGWPALVHFGENVKHMVRDCEVDANRFHGKGADSICRLKIWRVSRDKLLLASKFVIAKCRSAG